MTDASAVATTGSDGAQPRQRLRLADRPPLVKESDLTAKHRLLVEYMVYGLDKPLLSGRIKREYPIVNTDGMKVGAEMKPIPIGEPLTLEEAAELVGMKRRTARILSAQPAWQRLLQRETMNFRHGVKARAWRNIDRIANERIDGTAADRKVALAANETLTGEPRTGGTTVNVQTNVGVSVKAGLVLRLPADAPVIPLEREGEHDQE
jgi:hypothetical protein